MKIIMISGKGGDIDYILTKGKQEESLMPSSLRNKLVAVALVNTIILLLSLE
jgi:hypothetical protein